jgi:hypothetical protein
MRHENEYFAENCKGVATKLVISIEFEKLG